MSSRLSGAIPTLVTNFLRELRMATKESVSDYARLNLDRDSIDGIIDEFMKQHGFCYENKVSDNKCRIEFGKTGEPSSTVVLHFCNDGTTTIQYKLGKNTRLGLLLAQTIKDSIHPDACVAVNLALKSVFKDNLDLVLSEINEENFAIDKTETNNNIKYIITSKKYHDSITITYFSTRTLLIQGRPLSSYKAFIYPLSQVLDKGSLEQVLYCKDGTRTENVSSVVAEGILKQIFGAVFPKLDGFVKKSLISGMCVRLASPDLPDYSMLLFPELRSLEAALKKLLSHHKYPVGKDGFGSFFIKDTSTGNFNCTIRNIDSKSINILNKGYALYHKHRHTIFHTNQAINTSRVIDSLEELNNLVSELQGCIKNIYKLL